MSSTVEDLIVNILFYMLGIINIAEGKGAGTILGLIFIGIALLKTYSIKKEAKA